MKCIQITGNNVDASDQSYVQNQFGESKDTALVEYLKKKKVELYYSSIQNTNLSLLVATQIVDKKH